MTWQHIKAVWTKSKSKGAARLVMLCIADHTNENKGDTAWPSVATIARETQVSERQVIRSIDSLVEAGEIAIEYAGNGRGNPTVYAFLLSKDDTMSPNDQPEKEAPAVTKGDTMSEKGDISAERVTFETEKGDMVSPEVIREIPEERKRKNNDSKTAVEPPANRDINAEYRAVVKVYEQEIGTITQLGSRLIMEALADHGSGQVVEAIGEAVKNNVRKWNYVSAILGNWKTNGRGNAPPRQSSNGKHASDYALKPGEMYESMGETFVVNEQGHYERVTNE